MVSRKGSPLTLIGAAIGLLVLFVIIAAPVLAPYPPDKISLSARLAAPSLQHLFGTDEVGRDLFSRRAFRRPGILWHRVRHRHHLDRHRFYRRLPVRCHRRHRRHGNHAVMDVFLALPALILAMALALHWDRACSTPCWRWPWCGSPPMCGWRAGQTLSLRNRTLCQASRSFGASPAYLLRWHILPNALSPIIVQATLDLGGTILTAPR